MTPEVVRFGSRHGQFLLKMSRCTNPECDCTEATFQLQEATEPGADAAEPVAFQIRIDGRTWEEIDPPSRPAEIAGLVAEFLRDYPAAERAALQEACLEKQRIARRLRGYRIDPRLIEEGELVLVRRDHFRPGEHLFRRSRLCVPD